MLAESGDGLSHEVKASSAGFIPQELRDQLAKMNVSFPNPFYNRPMAATTRAALLTNGITVSADWRSKELRPEIVEDADLMITALPEQKEELVSLFPKAWLKIFSIREMSKWDRYLISEDSTRVPLDESFWDYVEENQDYVSKVISETEEILIQAFPNILNHLGVENRR
jgi:protein-tyrosine-phosphatase